MRLCGGGKVPGECGRRERKGGVSDGTGPGESWDGVWSGAGGDMPRAGGGEPDGEAHILSSTVGLTWIHRPGVGWAREGPLVQFPMTSCSG